ncbi:oligosaccharide flippase family protein [Mesorhizobium xinjiangense]|uniref:oligosaccharide flippase family protein n=1 Tax=Mesorhizobium xinjiangense TaxID=2678685 RepID=UPI0012EDFEDA|nr:oligosaccharide flippase family protein [Mesorhizobium xinjiangense]
MSDVKRALFLSTGDRYFALVANFVTVAIVSRILTPGEIGVSVVGMAIVGIAMSAREFASANYLIQRHDLTREDVRSAFTVMLVLISMISIALAATAPALAGIYDEERLVAYLRVISLSLFIELIAAPILTLLRRDMAFGAVAIINMSGAAVAAVVTVTLALLGFSYMSFAWAWLCSALTTGLLAIALKRQVWMYRPLFDHWRDMLTFGGYNGATNMLYKAYEALPYLLLGRVLSLDAAALYNRSLMICQLPDKAFLGGAMSVILPAFSVETRQGRSLKQPYLKALGLITALQWPALTVLAVLAYPAVDILFGDQWGAAAPLVQIVAIASLFSFSFELNYPVLVSLGAVRDIFLRALIVCPVSAGILVAASFYGLQAVAWSLMIVMPFQAFVSLSFVRRHVRIAWSEIAAAVWRSGVVTVAALAGPLAVVAAGAGFDMPIHMAVTAGVFAAAGWMCGLWLTGHALFDEIVTTLSGLRSHLPRLAGMA